MRNSSSPASFDETQHPRGQPGNAGQFKRKTLPAPPPASRGRVKEAVRRQYRYHTSWLPQVLWSRRRKVSMAVAGSMFEAVLDHMDEWRRWADSHPGDPRAAKPPFSDDLLARVEAFDSSQLDRSQQRALAEAWDEHGDEKNCGAGCWESSDARAAFDSAIASICGRSPDETASDMAQVIAVRRLIDEIRGTPGASTVCQAPGECSGSRSRPPARPESSSN